MGTQSLGTQSLGTQSLGARLVIKQVLLAALIATAGCAGLLGADFDEVRLGAVGGAGGSNTGGAGGGSSVGSAGAGSGAGGSAPLMTLVLDDLRPGALAVDDNHVYYVIDENGSDPADGIWRVPRDGGSAEPLVMQEAPIRHLVMDATHLYFTTNNILRKAPKAGGASMQLYQGDSFDEIQGLALQNGQLYWTAKNGPSVDGFVRTIDIDGNGYAELAALGSGTDPHHIAVNTSDLFWANALTREVVRMPIGGGAITLLVGDLHSPTELAINDSHVCFGQLGIINAVELDGSNHASLSQSGQTFGAAASASHCYFGLNTGLVRAPLEMTTSILHAEVPNVKAAHYHGGRVFFTADSGNGIVFSAPP